MKKEELTKLGLSDEVADKVIALAKQELSDYIPRSRFNEVNQRLSDVTKERDDQFAELSKIKGNEDVLNKKLAELKQQSEQSLKDYQTRLSNNSKTYAIKEKLLNGANKPHDLDLILSLVKLDQVTLNDDGSVIGVDEQIKNLAKNKPFLFKSNEQSTNSQSFKLNGQVPTDPIVGQNVKQEKTDPSVAFASKLASNKLKMMGVNVTNNGV